MIIETQANPNSRRKRSPGDLSAYVGGDLGEPTIDQIQQKVCLYQYYRTFRRTESYIGIQSSSTFSIFWTCGNIYFHINLF
jgi:hypothetical protein